MSSVILYAHIISFALVLLVAGAVHITEIQMARAESVAVARTALRTSVALGPGFGIGSVLIVATGYSLANRHVGGADVGSAWVVAAVVGLVLINVFGAAVLGRRAKALLASFDGAADGPLSAEQRAQLHDRLLSVGGWTNTAIAFGIVGLMVRKPDAGGSLVTLVVAAVVGLAVGSAQHAALGQRAPEPLAA